MLEVSWDVPPGKGLCAETLVLTSPSTVPPAPWLCTVLWARGDKYMELLSSWFSALCPWTLLSSIGWWGELHVLQQRKREGKIPGVWSFPQAGNFLQAKDLPEQDAKLHLCRAPAGEDNVGNAVALGWDLFSFPQDHRHNCPLEDFQHQALEPCQRAAGGSAKPCATSKQVQTHGHPVGTHLMPKFNQT